ncbi:MAG: glycosyltransferase family 2 protein [archaeon]
MKNKIKATLVILNYNEIEGLKSLYSKIPINRLDETFAIDPGSTDGSVEFLKKKGVRIVLQKKRGRAEAFRIGARIAKNEHIVYFGPDGNEDPNDIIRLISWLEKGYDMSVASRFMKGAQADDSHLPFPIRGIGNKVFTAISNLLWNGRLTDAINGFRAVKRDKFLALRPDTEGFGIEYQLSIRALKKRYRIKEIPTKEEPRIGGESTAHTFATGWLLLRIIFRELVR